VLAEALRRAWALGAGPGSGQLVIDLDSTICEVCGKAKTRCRLRLHAQAGYHPLIATRAWTGEYSTSGCAKVQPTPNAGRCVSSRNWRPGYAGRGHGGTDHALRLGLLVQRPIATLERLDVGYTMGVKMMKAVVKMVDGIDEAGLDPIDYSADGEAEVAECDLNGRRLIVPPHPARRSSSDAVAAVAALRLRGPTWRAKRWTSMPSTERSHGRAGHPRPEGGRRPRARPSGQFFANAAWLSVRRARHDSSADRHAR